MYFKMKKLRDIECVKMKEASNALWMIKTKCNKDWTEELFAESLLLKTHLSYKLIVGKICDSKDTSTEIKKKKLSGAISLSNLQYELAFPEKHTRETFYILAISHDTLVLTSKTIRASEDYRLTFNETFSLTELDDDFEVKVEIFSIRLNTSKPGIVDKLLKRKPKCCCPIRKIYYENVNTAELKESEILKSSFKSCGYFSITAKDLKSSKFLVRQTDALDRAVRATIKVDRMTLNTQLSGFLTLGKEDVQNNVHHWERKWCILDENVMSIYNSPRDQELDEPAASKINLEYCLVPLLKHPADCPRKRTFVVRTGRPATFGQGNEEIIDRKNHFIVNKIYLSADNKDDFEMWTQALDSAFEHLGLWHKLLLNQ